MEASTSTPERARPPKSYAATRNTLDRAVLAGVTLIWTIIVVGAYFGKVPFAHAPALAAAYPALLIVILALRRPFIEHEVKLALGWSALIAAALYVGARAETSSELLLSVTAIIAAAAAAAKFPTTAVFGALIATAVYGSVQAYWTFNLTPLADLMLAGLWVSLLIRAALGWRPTGWIVWPAVLVAALYLGITAIGIFTAESTSIGYLSFRFSAWPMLAFIVIAYAGWSETTYRNMARAIVAVGALVAGYAVYRWLAGPSPEEYQLGAVANKGINFIGDRLRTFGSFPTGHTLGFWAAVMAPYALSLALAARDRWRLIGGAATILCLFALLAAEGRAVLIGAVLGMLSVVALFGLSRSLRGPRFVAAIFATIAVMGIGSAAFVATAGSTGTVDRYERIFDPGDDFAYQARQQKWGEAMNEIAENPLGQGLGTAGQIEETSAAYYTIALYNLDNSYLKIAYEQGPAVALIFIVALALLLFSLAKGAITTASTEAAWRAVGAFGTLVAFAVSAYAANYIESPPVLFVWIIVGIGIAGLVRPGPDGEIGDKASAQA